jgi:SSS family solute:Na+ symporter
MLANPVISNVLTTLDIVVFVLLTGSTLAFVFWGHLRKSKPKDEDESFLDLMLMGRRLTLPMFIATLVATWYGGIFGVSQMAFKYGIFNFITQGVFWYITYAIFALFILKKIDISKAMTLPDLVGQMFGPKSGKLAALMNILNLVPIAYTISMGLLIKMVFGIQLEYGILIGVSFVLCYSFVGGFRAIVFSDIFQFFIMVTSVLLVFGISIGTYGFDVLDSLPSYFFEPLSKFSLFDPLAWGFIALSTLVDPNFYQRCFAASSPDTAKRGILISTVIWIIFDISLTIGAMYARAIIPEADSEYGYFLYSLQLLPPGLRGFFLAGITATILSTLDSYIFLAGSTIAFDLVPKKFKGKIWVHHLGIVSVAILSILMSQIFEGDIKAVWKSLGSLSSCAILLPVLFGMIFKNQLSDKGFLLSAAMGGFGVIYWRLSGLKYSMNLDEIYIGMLLSMLGIIASISIKRLKVN